MNKKRFTWLDGVLLGLLVLVAIVAAVLYFGKKEAPPVAAQEYELTLQFTQATTDPYDFYKVGDTLYTQNRTGVIGTITELTLLDKAQEKYDPATGKYITYTDSVHKTVQMKVRAAGAVSEGELKIGGQSILIGKTFYPQTDTTRSIMTVWNIEEVAA